jgi:hypothetical protein
VRHPRNPEQPLEPMAALVAVAWTQYGPPGRAGHGFAGPEFNALIDQLVQAYEQWLYGPLADPPHGDDAIDQYGPLILDAQRTLTSHTLLPPVTPGTVRITHSFGLRAAAPRSREHLLDQILQHGLQPQPGDSGRHSENPHAVFGIADYPPGPHEGRLYSPDAPWIVADLKRRDDWKRYTDAELVLPNYRDPHDVQPGWIVYVNQIPRDMLVAINGCPLDLFLTARRALRPR